MKRMLHIFTVVFCATANIMAQEVHGVESRMVCTYDCNPNGSWADWGNYNNGYEHTPWFSYEFTNMNTIAVSVEVELYHYEFIKKERYETIYDYVLIGTKSFVLKSGETYLWKNGKEAGIARHNRQWYETYMNGHKDYYVTYKAYKLL